MRLDGRLIVFLVVSLHGVSAVRPRYQHFEDYLNNLDSNEQSWIANSVDEEPDEGNNEENQETPTSSSTTTTPSTTPSTTTTTMASYIQDSHGRSQDVTCCMLGQMAGDKGYHCYAQYYAARIVARNRNRVHNRKMAFYGPQRIRNYGEKLMRTFEQCVASRGTVFHKCCHLSSMERRVDRYDTVQRARYRHQHGDDDDESEEKDA